MVVILFFFLLRRQEERKEIESDVQTICILSK